MVADHVPPHKWRAVISIVALLCLAAVLLVTALMLGAANPPQARTLILDVTPSTELPCAPLTSNSCVVSLGNLPAPPFTIEAAARNDGVSTSGWGLWLGQREAPTDASLFLIDNDGYIVTNSTSDDWRQFIHARPRENVLTLHVTESATATLRINEEVAWQGTLSVDNLSTFGILLYGEQDITWREVRLYAG